MVSNPKKRQSSRRILGQLDNFDQDVIIDNAASERQENIMVNESTSDRVFTLAISSSNRVFNANAVNVTTLERCFNVRIGREMNKKVDTVEDRIQNAILTAIDGNVAAKIEHAIRSINAFPGRETTSVAAKLECKEYVVISASFENASGNNNIQKVLNGNYETPNNILDEVYELLLPEKRFDWQKYAHHMATGQTTETNQIPEVLTGSILTPRSAPSYQNHNLSTQVSQDKNLPMVEHKPRNQNSHTNNSIYHFADAIAETAT